MASRSRFAAFQSAGIRFAATYAGLLAVSGAALALFLWWATAGLLDRQTEAAITTDALGLSERWADGGLRALVAAIGDRLAGNIDDDAVYLLADPSYGQVTGNLDRWPPSVREAGQFYELQVMRAGMRSLARVQAYDLPQGYHLLIGRDVVVRSQLRQLLTDALLWALVIVCGLAWIGAFVVRGMFRRTLSSVSQTALAIAGGDLTQRVPLTGRGDEFDQLAEVINDMLDRIARLMEGVRQVSNAIAHDLRTPIARARTRLEDASLHAESAADLHSAIERATADLDGIVGVFQALLRISEIEAGSRRAAFDRVDLIPPLAGVAELYEAVAEARGVTLMADLPAHVTIFGDAALVQQAVANLVDNAVKFSPDGGTATLAVRVLAAGVEIEVTDHGPGIPAEERQKATQRFYRGEAARHTPGSGLGLALVQAVAQLHGGTLRLEDAVPGLRAVLVLPQSGGVQTV